MDLNDAPLSRIVNTPFEAVGARRPLMLGQVSWSRSRIALIRPGLMRRRMMDDCLWCCDVG